MKGKIGGKGYKQVEIVFSKIFAPNRSKYNAKLKAIQNGAVTKSDIAKSTEIYTASPPFFLVIIQRYTNLSYLHKKSSIDS